MLATGCSSSDSPSTAAPSTDTVPLMVDGLYMNDAPTTGPYSQISFIGYTGRYIAQTNPCADPSTGACQETGSFAGNSEGYLVLTSDIPDADGTAHVTEMPFSVGQTIKTGTLPAPPTEVDLNAPQTGDIIITIGTGGGSGGGSDAGSGSSGSGTLISVSSDGGGALVINASLGALVNLITQAILGTSSFTLINDNNGMPVSTSNPPVAAPVGTSGSSGSGGSGGSGGSTGSSGGGTSSGGSGGGGTSSGGSGTSPASDGGSSNGGLIKPVAGGKINPNHLMDDGDMLGGTSITVEKVQALLTSQRSALATLNQNGMSAAQLIVAQSTANGISPLYIIARIETESGLIHSTTTRNIGSATGCGCPDGSACNVMVAGFSNQVACAAKLMAGYTRALQGGGSTVSGWKTNVAKKTLDPCTVTPDGIASAASYTYTPWVGAYSSTGCGSLANGGSTLLATMVQRYKAALQ